MPFLQRQHEGVGEREKRRNYTAVSLETGLVISWYITFILQKDTENLPLHSILFPIPVCL